MQNHNDYHNNSSKSNANCKEYKYNPYNFVSLGNKCIRVPYEKGNLTGKIHCTIYPKSDLFIPNTDNTCTWNGRKNADHVAREFFSYQSIPDNYNMSEKTPPESPVIPGSELRGMIRNMYETFTDSCFSAFDDTALSSRLPIARSPGILSVDSHENWKLYKANKYLINTDKNYKKAVTFEINNENGSKTIEGNKNFSKVRFKFERDGMLSKVTSIGKSGSKEGYLIIGEKKVDDDGNCLKHYECIFEKKYNKNDNRYDEEKIQSKILKEAIKEYNSVIDLYRKFADDDNWYADSYIDVNKKEPAEFPVWYNVVEDDNGRKVKAYFSPACIGRNSYEKTLGDLIKTFKPCTGNLNSNNEKCYCEACRLFGMIGKFKNLENKEEQSVLPSSVRISDAVFTGKKPEYRDITTLKELAGPKNSSLEMYTHLVGIDAKFWTYEFYRKIVPDTRPGKEGKTISKYILLGDGNLELNGRKFYYHNTTNKNYREEHDKKDKNGKDVEQTERNMTVRPLKGVDSNKFEFDVFFEHISEEQLKKILVVLSLRGNNSSYCYKIGTGKPLGLGSIKVVVDDVFIRTFDNKTMKYNFSGTSDYSDYFKKDMISVFDISQDDERMSMLNEMLDINTFTKEEMLKIGYPVGKDDKGKPGEGYQWFMNNRGFIGKPEYKQLLNTFGNKSYRPNEKGRLNNN